jgi:hypothetical protein
MDLGYLERSKQEGDIRFVVWFKKQLELKVLSLIALLFSAMLEKFFTANMVLIGKNNIIPGCRYSGEFQPNSPVDARKSK